MAKNEAQSPPPAPVSRWSRLLRKASDNVTPQEPLTMAEFMKVAKAKIDSLSGELNTLSQEIWTHPELNFNEHHAHEVLTDFLEKEGFKVERHFVMETAFRATFGSDNAGPNICVICEYDALPEIGHACGHNLIAECGAAAGVGIKAALEASGNKYGKVTVLGTPAEEGGGGKKRLIKANAFVGIAVAMMAHPYRYNVPRPIALSMTGLIFKFKGKAAHASAAPWDGQNALDAAVTCYQSISNMRQQVKPSSRIHGIFTNGGAAPNIIPDEAELTYYLRALDEADLSIIKKKIKACAEGAAMATGCEVNTEDGVTHSKLLTNNFLATLYEKHSVDLGIETTNGQRGQSMVTTDFGDVSQAVPSICPMYSVLNTTAYSLLEFKATAGNMVEFGSVTSYANLVTNDGLACMYEGQARAMGVDFNSDENLRRGGSTDMGNVSFVVPSIHPKYAIGQGEATHTRPFTAVAGAPEAQAPTLLQAKALAMTAIELLQPSGQDTLKKIQKEFKETISKLPAPVDDE